MVQKAYFDIDYQGPKMDLNGKPLESDIRRMPSLVFVETMGS